MARSGTTLLLGAGFSQSLGLPGTTRLTEEVRRLQQPVVSPPLPPPLEGAPLADMLWRMLSSYYSEPNFETMLHAIEAMLSVQSGVVGVDLPDEIKPIVNAFMDVTPRWAPLASSRELRNLASRVLSTVADSLVQSRAADFKQDVFDGNREAFRRIQGTDPYNVVNLNYDTTGYEMFDAAEDGFAFANGAAPTASFDYSRLRAADDRDIILHPHGCVLYGFEPVPDAVGGATPKNAGSRRDLLRYRDTTTASQSWPLNEDIGSQAGESIIVGPIITGLRKAEKARYGPYAYYLHLFVESLLQSPRLVLCGYGGRDAYINHWIEQWLQRHGARARCAIVTDGSTGESNHMLRLAYGLISKTNTRANELPAPGKAFCQRAANEESIQEGAFYVATRKVPLSDDALRDIVAFLNG